MELGCSLLVHPCPICARRRSLDHLGRTQIRLEKAYCQLEKLANLDKLPATGFMVSCFPFKIRGASAGFTRAVAIFQD